MRILLSMVISLGLASGMYLIFLHETSKATGGSPQAATATVAVQMHLVNLAQAERMYFVQNNSYATIDQLAASGDFKMPNPDPNGYVHNVDVSPSGFTATAQHASASGKADNFPVFSIDQGMHVHRGDDSAGGANPAPIAPAAPADASQQGDAAKASNSKTSDSSSDSVPSFPEALPGLPAGIVSGNSSSSSN